jgi:DNA polymerase-2
VSSVHGFVVSAWDERARAGRRRILATGRLVDGRSFALVMGAPPPAIYVVADVAGRAQTVLGQSCAVEPWTSFEGRTLARLVLERVQPSEAEARLAAAGIHVHATDGSTAADALLALGVRGPVEIRGGTVTKGRRVDVVFADPVIAPCAAAPSLGWLAIAVDVRDGQVASISIAGCGDSAVLVGAEREQLAEFAERVRARDPDVITGWSVEADLAVLAQRAATHRIPLDLGRIAGTTHVHTRKTGRVTVDVAGRAIVDAMRIVRASGERFDDDGDDIREPAHVLETLRTAGLDALTVRRAALTGVALDLAWTSIPAFERIYGEALRVRRIVPPPRVERSLEAAGGTVLDAEAGLFANVLVFDFRSLYPSLMRTFNIDPLAHERARGGEDDLVAPNGARFARGEGILPAILTAYAREREAALAAGDDIAAFVYKILQNSFYGVLGASGCRYARGALAGAITSFGKQFLTTARDWFEARRYHVLYGDTDSVFVRSPDATCDHATLATVAAALADELNRHLAATIHADHGVESHVRIRCDKIYRRFFISRLRGDSSSDGRGRGKGYAGLRLDEGDVTELEVRGMEAVRSDFTPLARRFQRELMALLFADADIATLRAHCSTEATRLARGELDAELVYRKVLRRAAQDYDSETPQVRAARMLGWRDRGGAIEYVMTRAGAEPLAARTDAPLDYEHYRDRQLVPIAQAIANVLGADTTGWFNGQLGLFAPAGMQ